MSDERKREALTPLERAAVLRMKEWQLSQPDVSPVVRVDSEREIAHTNAYEAQVPNSRWEKVKQERKVEGLVRIDRVLDELERSMERGR